MMVTEQTKKDVAKALKQAFAKAELALEGSYRLTKDGVHFRAAEGVRPTWFDDLWDRSPQFRQVLKEAYHKGVRTIQVITTRDAIVLCVEGKTFLYRW